MGPSAAEQAEADETPMAQDQSPTEHRRIPDDPTAVIGRRGLAWLVDTVIGGVIVAGVFVYEAMRQFDLVQFKTTSAAEDYCDIIFSEETQCVVSDNSVWSITGDFVINEPRLWILSAILVVLLTMLLPGITGWTPGKLLMELRIVDSETYEPAGLRANAVRGLCLVVDALPYAIPLVGLIAGFGDTAMAFLVFGVLLFPLAGLIAAVVGKQSQRIGDLAAGTLVVDKSALGRPPSAEAAAADEGSPADEDSESLDTEDAAGGPRETGGLAEGQ